jgi:hypothetical protein
MEEFPAVVADSVVIALITPGSFCARGTSPLNTTRTGVKHEAGGASSRC